MEIFSLEFLMLVLGTWLGMVILPGKVSKKIFLLVISLFFLARYLYSVDPVLVSNKLLLLTSFIAYGYLGCQLGFLENKKKIGHYFFVIWIVSYLLFYILITKSKEFTGLLPSSLLDYFLFVVGVSYILLRQIHVSIDIKSGLIKEIDHLTYFNYLLSFHSLLAGPIARYSEYARVLDNISPAIDIDTIVSALNRIVSGLVKKYVFAAIIFSSIASPVSGWGRMSDPYDFWVSFHFFAVYEYLDFSGYMDIMIGIGILIGVQIPENFNRPYISRNLLDFWTRWHITLANWMRDYVFNPVSLRLARLFPDHLLIIGFTTYVMTFTLIGLWHGLSWGFFLWGLSQGLGLGIVKSYEFFLRARLGRKGYKAYLQNNSIRILSTIITLEYFICTVGFVLLDMWKVI